MAFETYIVDKFLYQVLATDTVLCGTTPPLINGVFKTLADQNTKNPYIVFTFQTATDVNTMNQFRVFSDFSYLIKVIGLDHSLSNIKTAANRMDDLLTNKKFWVTADGTMLSIVRQSIFELMEQEQGGNQYVQIGGTYRILAQAS